VTGAGKLDGGEFVAIQPKLAFQRQLRTVFNLGTIGELTDGQLVERFATRGGEAAELAFAALVERHGPMVLRVCRHAFDDQNDAEDAFQATFLILVKQARSLWVRDSLGPWLHRVAHRVATRARLSATRRREHERRAAAARPTSGAERGDWEELLTLLHEEIERLPERYRAPVVLCDLQGLTHERAARHLGWPVGTVKSRLARARELLRGRLSRRGMGLPAGLLISEKALAQAFHFRGVEVVLSGRLVESTVRAAVPFAAGKALAVGAISSRVAILIEEVLKTMVVSKLKLASAFVLLIGAAGAAGVLAQQGSRSGANPAAEQAQRPASAASRRAALVDSVRAPVPAYIAQSRAMILTRLEEEVAEARARLDRTLRRFRSPDNPAVVRARETLEALVERLDRIDQVLVDVVETYPTMVDFSRGPDLPTQLRLGAVPQYRDRAAQGPAVESPDQADPARARDQVEWVQERPNQDESAPARKHPGNRQQGQKPQAPHRDQDKYQGQQGEQNQPQSGEKYNDSGQQGAHGKPQSGEKYNDSGQQGKKNQPQSGDKYNDSGQKGQQGKPQSGEAQNDAATPGLNSKDQPGESPDNSAKPGQNSKDQPGESQDNGAKPGQNSKDQPGESQDNGAKPSQNSQSQRRDVQIDKALRSDSKPRGHGSGVVSADLNGDGVIDIFVVNDDIAKQPPKSDGQRGNASKDSAKQPPKSDAQPGNASKDSAKQQPKSDAQPGNASKDSAKQPPKSQIQQRQKRDGWSQRDRNRQAQPGQPKTDSGQQKPKSPVDQTRPRTDSGQQKSKSPVDQTQQTTDSGKRG
jgi:RNA polymerase sigma factor (sigma-70 family)